MNYAEIKELVLRDSKKVGALMSVVLTLVFSLFMMLVGANLVNFFTVVAVPMAIIGVLREKEASIRNLRDWDILNVVTLLWVPIMIFLAALFS